MNDDQTAIVRVVHVGADGAPDGLQVAGDRELLWVSATSSSAESIGQIANELKLHPLIVEDLQKLGQRPKIERYGDMLLISAYTVTGLPDSEVPRQAQLVEIALLVGPRWILTASEVPIPAIDRLAAEAVAGRGLSRDLLLHRILDEVVDGLLIAAERLSDEVGELELAIYGGSVGDINELRRMRRAVFKLYAITGQQRVALGGLANELDELPGFTRDLYHYFRDVVDHCDRAYNEASLAREMVTHAFDGYLAMLANRQNDVVRRLTVISTIFLPLMFITGFFGMNFGWMVDWIDGWLAFALLGVGTSAVSAACVMIWMRRNSMSWD